MKSVIQQYLEQRPRYWRLFQLTSFEKIEPAHIRKDLISLRTNGGIPELLLALVLNSFLTHKRRIAIISSNDLMDLISALDPSLRKGVLRRGGGGKSMYQAFLALSTKDLGILKLLNEPGGRIPGVYELINESFASLLPPLDEETRATVLQAAQVCQRRR